MCNAILSTNSIPWNIYIPFTGDSHYFELTPQYASTIKMYHAKCTEGFVVHEESVERSVYMIHPKTYINQFIVTYLENGKSSTLRLSCYMAAYSNRVAPEKRWKR